MLQYIPKDDHLLYLAGGYFDLAFLVLLWSYECVGYDLEQVHDIGNEFGLIVVCLGVSNMHFWTDIVVVENSISVPQHSSLFLSTRNYQK
jgi:hypothetical protein